MISTFVPKGSFSFNPKLLNNTDLTEPMDAEHQRADTDQDRDDSIDEKTEKPVKSTDIGAMIG